jgi:hypothetical protein
MHNMTQEIDGKSSRYNNNKIVYSNLPPALLRDMHDNVGMQPYFGLNKLAEHYTLAAAKYPNASAGNHSFPNWAKGQLFEAFVIDSMYRHLYAYFHGEYIDPDFGSHHLVSVAWGAAALYHFFSYYELYKEFDDRKWVGFTLEGYKDSDKLKSHHNLLITLLTIVQTSTDIPSILVALRDIFVEALHKVETDYPTATIKYTVDIERLNKIQNTDYGTAKQSTQT